VAFERTRTSTPPSICLNRRVNVELRVSVSTSDPATKPTPSTMASDVSAKRSLWARRLLSVALNMDGRRKRGLSPLQLLEAVEHLLGRGTAHLGNDLAVVEEHDPVGVAGRGRVVG